MSFFVARAVPFGRFCFDFSPRTSWHGWLCVGMARSSCSILHVDRVGATSGLFVVCGEAFVFSTVAVRRSRRTTHETTQRRSRLKTVQPEVQTFPGKLTVDPQSPLEPKLAIGLQGQIKLGQPTDTRVDVA